MQNFSTAEVFFFISSVGFIIIWLLAVVFAFYLIAAVKTFSRIVSKIEQSVDSVGDITKELLGEVKESMIFKFLFGKKKRAKSK
jgi:amino acid permease